MGAQLLHERGHASGATLVDGRARPGHRELARAVAALAADDDPVETRYLGELARISELAAGLSRPQVPGTRRLAIAGAFVVAEAVRHDVGCRATDGLLTEIA